MAESEQLDHLIQTLRNGVEKLLEAGLSEYQISIALGLKHRTNPKMSIRKKAFWAGLTEEEKRNQLTNLIASIPRKPDWLHQAVINDYNRGMSTRELSKKYQISATTVWSWIKKAGLIRSHSDAALLWRKQERQEKEEDVTTDKQ